MSLLNLEQRLNHRFATKALLEQALTHRSHNSGKHNERLEFLGDSVLNFVVAAILYERYQAIDEGDLSRIRANLVKQATLVEIAQKLELSAYLRLGEGELKSGGFRRPSILADAVEAIVAAVFLDAGFDAARRVVEHQYIPMLDTIDPNALGKDAKTLLQEFLQHYKLQLPVYTVIATHGAAHNQQFEVSCTVAELDIIVTAAGATRRSAEQLAAEQVLYAAKALHEQQPLDRKRPKKTKTAQLSLPVAVNQEHDTQ